MHLKIVGTYNKEVSDSHLNRKPSPLELRKAAADTPALNLALEPDPILSKPTFISCGSRPGE